MELVKKIMIIGAGAGQVPIIRASKERGLYTLVVSPDGPYPGIPEADKWIPIDIYDKEAVLSVAKNECIDYVISDQSDFAVPTVAYIAENMGLIGNSSKTADIYSDKSIQRKFCVDNHFSVPLSVVIHGESDIKNIPFRFPWVIKPADSQGSRGIKKVNSVDDAISAYHSALAYSKKGIVVAEEYIEGTEIVCEGFIVDGEYINVAFGDRLYFDLKDQFIPSQTVFPSMAFSLAKEKMIEQDSLFVKESGAKFGTMHSEYIVSVDGSVHLVETALRGGGVYISSHLIRLSSGIDLTNMLLNYLLLGGEKTREILYSSRKECPSSTAYLCFYLKKGKISAITGVDEIRMNPHIIISEVDNLHVDMEYKGLIHKGCRLGPFVIASNNLDELKKDIEWVKEKFHVYVDNLKDDAIVWL